LLMKLSKSLTLLSLLGAAFFLTACEQPSAAAAAGAAAETEAGTKAEAQPVEAAKWITDYETALSQAREQGKSVLMNFTGSDWCPPCKLLKRDVFETEEFAAYAAENLILLELDFPRSFEQPAALAKQNQTLLGTYETEVFPTLILLNSQGTEVRRTMGYMRGGPDAFI